MDEVHATSGQFIRWAWREWKTSRAYRHADEELFARARPPRWFIDSELGFGLGQGPSIAYTAAVLEQSNRRALKLLGDKRRPSYPLPGPRERMRLLSRLAARLVRPPPPLLAEPTLAAAE